MADAAPVERRSLPRMLTEPTRTTAAVTPVMWAVAAATSDMDCMAGIAEASAAAIVVTADTAAMAAGADTVTPTTVTDSVVADIDVTAATARPIVPAARLSSPSLRPPAVLRWPRAAVPAPAAP